MTTSVSVTVAGGLLTCPDPSASQKDVLRYVHAILNCGQLLGSSLTKMSLSNQTLAVLFQQGLFPISSRIRASFIRSGVVEYDSNTVSQVVNALVDRCTDFDSEYLVRDVLFDEMTITPDVFLREADDSLVADGTRLALLLSILQSDCAGDLDTHVLLTNGEVDYGTVRISCRLVALEHSRSDIDLPRLTSGGYSGSTTILCKPCSISDYVDAREIWLGGESPEAVAQFIAMVAEEYQVTGRTTSEARSFRFGARFAQTVKSCCMSAPTSVVDKLTRAIIATILDENMSMTHELRVSSGGGSSQRRRADDFAWRRDIDNELHLHYWVCDGGQVEFASVVHHNDFSIPE